MRFCLRDNVCDSVSGVCGDGLNNDYISFLYHSSLIFDTWIVFQASEKDI